MPMTHPIFNQARRVLSAATDKAEMVNRLDGDRFIPAARVPKDRSLLLADQAAADSNPVNRGRPGS